MSWVCSLTLPRILCGHATKLTSAHKSTGSAWVMQVYLGVWKDQEVAVKLARQAPISLKNERQFQAHIAMLHNLNHPNIVTFLGACCWKASLSAQLLTPIFDTLSHLGYIHSQCRYTGKDISSGPCRLCLLYGIATLGSLCLIYMMLLVIHHYLEKSEPKFQFSRLN